MFQALIAILVGTIQWKMRLRRCLVKENLDNVVLFEYRGKMYDRKKFIQLQAETIRETNTKKKKLEKELAQLELDLIKSKRMDLDLAIIEAYRLVISEM